jgi:hypothetical protein
VCLKAGPLFPRLILGVQQLCLLLIVLLVFLVGLGFWLWKFLQQIVDTNEIHHCNVAVLISVLFSVHNVINLRNKWNWKWNVRHSLIIWVVKHVDCTYYWVNHLNQMHWDFFLEVFSSPQPACLTSCRLTHSSLSHSHELSSASGWYLSVCQILLLHEAIISSTVGTAVAMWPECDKLNLIRALNTGRFFRRINYTVLPLYGISRFVALIFSKHRIQLFYPFNVGIKSIRATLPDKIFTGDFTSWTVNFVSTCVKNQQMQQLFIQFVNYVR